MLRKIIFILFLSVSFAAECYIEFDSPQSEIIVGDTIELRIEIDTEDEAIVAYSYYLNIDPVIFQPIFMYNVPTDSWLPFIPVDMDISMQTIQNDTLSASRMVYKTWEAAEPLVGLGVVAYFSLKVLSIPTNDNNSTVIDFEYNDVGQRTEYSTLEENGGYEPHEFGSMYSKTVQVQGYDIFPEIPDLTLIPGDTLNIDLNNYFQSTVYPSSDAQWLFAAFDSVNGVSVNIDNENNILAVSSESNSHGILHGLMTLTMDGMQLERVQNWNIIVDHPIEFLPNLTRINIFEDDTLFLPTDSLFYNIDDREDMISIDYFIISQSELELFYDNNDTIGFFSISDWYGPGNIHLSVTESLGRTIEDTLNFQVVNVDDPMELDFYGISGDSTMGDSLTLYHNTPQNINLRPFVHDIDDNNFRWSFEPHDGIVIDSVSENIYRLTFDTDQSGNFFLGHTSLLVTVTDSDNEASATDTIQLNIRSLLPQFLISGPLRVHIDTSYVVSLDTVVFDPDTPPELLVWDFSFLTPEGSQDDDVIFDYNSESYILTINSNHLINSDGILVVTIEENFEFGNVVTKEIPIFYFVSNAPQINTPDTLFTSPGTLLAALDLDTLVYDYFDPPDSISWSLSETGVLEDVYIDPDDNILYILTDSDFIGETTLTLVATNTSNLNDTAEILVVVVPPIPQISELPDDNIYWHTESYFLFDLDNYILDEPDPIQNPLEWIASYNTDAIDVFINDESQAFITTYAVLGPVTIIFTAENVVGYQASDTISVNIIQDDPPEWEHLLNIEMSKFLPYDTLSYSLSDKCSDDLTVDSKNLIYSVQTDPVILSAEIDSLSNVSLTLLDTSVTTTFLTFSAEDEHHNISYSDTINITVLNGFPPFWENLPLIIFGNDTTYLSECLEEWCADPDTPDSLLNFFIVMTSSTELYADIVTGETCRYLSISTLSEIDGPYSIIIQARDQQQNVSTKYVSISITDMIASDANLSYFITPGLYRRLHFILTSDGSVSDISNSFFLDDSLLGSLSFALIDQKPELQTWNAPYRFTESGTYSVFVNLTDASGNTAEDSLSLSVAMPVSEGGSLKSPSGKMLVEYPGTDYSGDQMLILEEGSLSAESYIDTAMTLYSIQSTIPDDIALIANFTGETDGTDFYSFYRVVEGQAVPIPTFIDKNGIFHTSVALNSHFYFGQSSNPAQDVVLPQDHMYCYPNPFNSVIQIMFFMPVEDEVKVSVYNILGERVFSYDHEAVPGLITLNWDGRDSYGQNLPTGLYFYHLSAGNKHMTSKITILK